MVQDHADLPSAGYIRDNIDFVVWWADGAARSNDHRRSGGIQRLFAAAGFASSAAHLAGQPGR